jgi:hypothetical protein
MWHRSSALAMICQDGDGFWVVVAARTEEELSWLDPFALEWDESDSRTSKPASDLCTHIGQGRTPNSRQIRAFGLAACHRYGELHRPPSSLA